MRGGAFVVMMLCAVQIAVAQIRIIPQERLREVELKAVASSLQFTPEKVDFGTIDELSEPWQGNARLENRGLDTVVITRIKSTGGCLRVEIAKRTLAPKESAMVTLKYYPRGHAGRVSQRVLVYTNLSDDKPSAILELRGVVTASADRSDDYPYSRGALRLRQEGVRFDGRVKQVERIACMNGGATELRPEVDKMFLPSGVKGYFEPATLAPKQEGSLVLEYLPTANTGAKEGAMAYIKGLGVPPRQSTIKIEFENR